LLYQLFYNLINNSIKFAKKDVPSTITLVSKTIIEEGNSFAVITLEDNGIGFEPKQAEQIFETFTRLNSKDSYEGTGLGLSLCKKIVERHGGSIVAIGSLAKGATFIIKLPLLQKENEI
jgi:signal transduction histidine kinase